MKVVPMKKLCAASMLFLFAALAGASSPSLSPDGGDCGEVCVATASYDPTGEPPGLVVLIGMGQNGAGDELCNTCPGQRCKLSVSAQWSAPPGNPMCFVWRKPPSTPGWSPPHKHYSRTGTITQGCNSTSAGLMQVGLVTCGNPQSTPQDIRTVTLACACDPGE